MSDRLAKFKWKPRRATLPQTRTCSQAEAIDLLRRDLFDDAVASRWLEPCCTKGNAKRDTKIYALDAVRAVEDRVLLGDYPPVRAKREAVEADDEGGAS